MAAGLGFKTFATGDVLSAADTNGYLMQGVLVFASAAARDSSITSPQEGQFAYLKDTNVTTYYTGSAWANLDTTGMVNPMTTTGDTIYSSSGSTPARLGIGSTGQVLTVAAGIPSWATPTATGFVGVSLCKSADQSISNTTLTAVTFNTELFDTDGFHDNSTNNSRITIPAGKAGKYLFTAKAMWLVNSGGGIRFIQLTKNGTDITGDNNVTPNASFGVTSQVNQVFNLAVSDYIEAKIYQDSGGALSVAGSASGLATVIQATYLGA